VTRGFFVRLQDQCAWLKGESDNCKDCMWAGHKSSFFVWICCG